MSRKNVHTSDAPAPDAPHWELDLPESKLPSSFFWTWDHSTNWVLDDPGLQNTGCYNPYLKHPDTFVEDYRRLTDLAAGLDIAGIVIWGFLRDAHGGVEHAKRVAAYAAEKGVDVMPGVGTTWYGGVYYEGDHEYCLPRFLEKHPDARMLGEDGTPHEFDGACGACLAHPEYQAWLSEAIRWLYDEFDIGGVNLENGDMLVDHHPCVKALRERWPADDPEEFFHQGMSYRQALEAVGDRLAGTLATYASYTGFNCTDALSQNTGMGTKPPAMLSILPEESVCQWTISGMLLDTPLPLTAYLDDGAPPAAFDNPDWPEGLVPVNKRSVGFAHQGSQWWGATRYACTVSTIKEACLRAYRSGLEGVAVHGEVTARYVPAALNYLAFSHFTHQPEGTLRDFGRKTLAQVFGDERTGECFAELLAHHDAGSLTEDMRTRIREEANAAFAKTRTRRPSGVFANDLDAWRIHGFWDWLRAAACGDDLLSHECFRF